MLEAVTLDSALSISNGKRFTLDLGGFKLTAVATTTVSGDNTELTIANGEIYAALDSIKAFDFNARITLAADAVLKGDTTAGEFLYVTSGTFDNYGKIIIDDTKYGDYCWAVVVCNGATFNGYEGCEVNGAAGAFKPKADKGKGFINLIGGSYKMHATGCGDSYGLFYGTKDDTSEITISGGVYETLKNGIFGLKSTYIVKSADGSEGLDDKCTAKFNNVDLVVTSKSGKSFTDFCKPGYGPVKDSDDDYYMVKKVWNVVFENGDVATTNVVADGATTTAPAEDPVKDGYIFKGWFNGDVAFDATVPVTADVTYTAKFEKAAFAIILADVTKGYAATLAEAVNAADDGDTIVLVDEEGYTTGDSEAIDFADDITLNMNGKTLNLSPTAMKSQLIKVLEGAELTLTNGTVVIDGNNDGNRGVNIHGTLNIACIVDCSAGGAGAAFDIYQGTVNVLPEADITAGYETFRLKDENLTSAINIKGGKIVNGQSNTMINNYKPGHVLNLTIEGGDISNGSAVFRNVDGAIMNLEIASTCAARFNNIKCKLNDKDTTSTLNNYVVDGYALVKDGDWYTVQQVFDITITDPENGTLETSVTNGVVAGTVVTVTATPATGFELESITTNGTAITGTTFEMPAEAVTVAATFKSAAPAWPEDWPGDADPAVVDKFADWQKANPGVTSFEGHEEQFLMNVAADAQVPELKIDSIAVEGNTATIVVSADGTNLKTVNGVLYVDGANDLTNWTTTEVDLAAAATFSEDGTTATFTVTSAKFMKAGVGFKAPVVEAE